VAASNWVGDLLVTMGSSSMVVVGFLLFVDSGGVGYRRTRLGIALG